MVQRAADFAVFSPLICTITLDQWTGKALAMKILVALATIIKTES